MPSFLGEGLLGRFFVPRGFAPGLPCLVCSSVAVFCLLFPFRAVLWLGLLAVARLEIDGKEVGPGWLFFWLLVVCCCCFVAFVISAFDGVFLVFLSRLPLLLLLCCWLLLL